MIPVFGVLKIKWKDMFEKDLVTLVTDGDIKKYLEKLELSVL